MEELLKKHQNKESALCGQRPASDSWTAVGTILDHETLNIVCREEHTDEVFLPANAKQTWLDWAATEPWQETDEAVDGELIDFSTEIPGSVNSTEPPEVEAPEATRREVASEVHQCDLSWHSDSKPMDVGHIPADLPDPDPGPPAESITAERFQTLAKELMKQMACGKLSLIWLLLSVASASPVEPPVKAQPRTPIRKQQLQSPGVIFARVNETETLQRSLGKDFVVEEGGELRVHSEPKRYGTCDKLSPETWAKRIKRHAEFLVVDKPAGVPCVPHVSNGRALVAHVGEWLVPFVAAAIAASRRKRTSREADEDIELVPCNRLDVQTSGLVVLAETKDAARHFQQLLLDGKVQKRYRALVPGQSLQANQTLEHKISDSVFGKPVPRLIAPINAATDDSVHKWRDARATIKRETIRGDQLQELEVELHTGRTHQLRAQLAAIGSPIVDDALYKSLSGFMWNDNSDDQQAALLVTAADRMSDAPIGLQCSKLEFEDEADPAYLDDENELKDRVGLDGGEPTSEGRAGAGAPGAAVPQWTFFSQRNWMMERRLQEYEDDPTIASRLANKKKQQQKKREEDTKRFRWLSSWIGLHHEE
eukprot:s2083_g7.t1